MTIYCPELKKASSIKHGFFTREGGVSSGVFSSLNCGYGSADDPENVRENRRRVIEEIGTVVEDLCTLYQIHSGNVINVTEQWEFANRPQADAMVTNRPNIPLGIMTADCAPVLFCDDETGVIGAAHSGWKGARNGILENTIEEMKKIGAKERNIVAAIGPCIGKNSYEVGAEFRNEFLKESSENKTFFATTNKENKYLFDLPSYILSRLERFRLKKISHTDHDTLSDEKQFFSYRRTTLYGENNYGRQVSVICLA